MKPLRIKNDPQQFPQQLFQTRNGESLNIQYINFNLKVVLQGGKNTLQSYQCINNLIIINTPTVPFARGGRNFPVFIEQIRIRVWLSD